jgi:hypothetical protein
LLAVKAAQFCKVLILLQKEELPPLSLTAQTAKQMVAR